MEPAVSLAGRMQPPPLFHCGEGSLPCWITGRWFSNKSPASCGPSQLFNSRNMCSPTAAAAALQPLLYYFFFFWIHNYKSLLGLFWQCVPSRVSVIAVAAGIDASLPWERKVWLWLFLGLLLWRWLPRLQLDFELRAIAVCCSHLSLIKIRWHIREANEWMVSAWHCNRPPIKPTAYD